MSTFIEIYTRTDDTATVDGRLIHRGYFPTIYDAAIADAQNMALDQGRAVLIKAIDGVGGGGTTWISLHPDGKLLPADAPQQEIVEQPGPQRGRRAVEPTDHDDEAAFYPPVSPPPPAVAVQDDQQLASQAHDEMPPARHGAPSWAFPADNSEPPAAGAERAPDAAPVPPFSAPPAPAPEPVQNRPESPQPDPRTGPIAVNVPSQQQFVPPQAPAREPYAQPWQPQGAQPAWQQSGPPAQFSPRPASPPPAGPVTFLSTTTPTAPPPTGFKAFLAKLGFASGPSEEDQRRWADERAVSQHWTGPRTIAIVNGKGGSTKTPSTAMLSAVFARFGGSGVAAWDANFTRGTLGWRTEQGSHDRTVLELIPKLEELLSPSANSADLAGYLHHQTLDKYDVLRSNPRLLKRHQQLTGELQDRVHQLLTKHYRLLFIDSGNDEGDSVWLRMIEQADAIAVASVNRDDHAEAAKELLQGLRESGSRSARLADNAVVIVSHGDVGERSKPATQYVEGFSRIARTVVTVPHDGALSSQWLRYDDLQPATQRAWLRAAAAIAEGLTQR